MSVHTVIMPITGFGTWKLDNTPSTTTIILDAIDVGYRHFDTAAFYQNECAIGEALKQRSIARDELFITSKVPSHIKSPEETREIFFKSLRDLGLDTLDLYLIHGPAPKDERHHSERYNEGNVAVWKTLETLYEEGFVRAIGVSNFSLADLENIRAHAKILPMVHQVPFYAGLNQEALLDDAKRHNMIIQAYSPLAKGGLISHPVVEELAQKYRKTPAQILLQYCRDMGTVPLPKTRSKARMIENLETLHALTQEDIKRLSELTHP